ncbi:MAG: hypothetical protein MUC33_21545 [Desulfobacterales bacterium]|jgi:hypothetical protein|nr:hypothetical protein [Desulfobacterales bacterium]
MRDEDDEMDTASTRSHQGGKFKLAIADKAKLTAWIDLVKNLGDSHEYMRFYSTLTHRVVFVWGVL